MALSNDLVSQFVKTTKDTSTVKNGNTLYGTIVSDDNNRYVMIDGSTIKTPISTTVVVNNGDRVTCIIKNHTAVVTGNLTSPAVRDKDFTFEQAKIIELQATNVEVQNKLTAHNAKIDSLEADNVTIKGELEANSANISELRADNVTINGRLTASEADIKELQSEMIEVDSLVATFATIENLNATNADIIDLDAEVADINTLIFGSATGNVIQTSFSNAIIAQLGDAQIKSAMIESVSASKITAGDIITNNVRVMSEDGSLIISDETIQIKDDTRVRVQIGKDASNDYSINVWDQNGNLMFSKGGITDAAIKEAIIRNDMVSDTANIHASKLDIDSLFEEINDDGSNAIKSTKVYLDDEKQTLDVAFKSLTTEVTDQGETISSQGTAISTIQGQISSKIWQQDINTAKNEMSTQYSTLEQEVDGFKTTVSETYATISETTNLGTRMTIVEQTADSLSVELENLEIGGRNILLKSDFSNKTNTDNFTYNSSERMVTVTSDTLTQTMTSSLKLSDYGKTKLSGSIIVISGEYKIPTTLQYGNTNPYIGIELALIRDSNTGGSSQWMSWFGGTTIGSDATDGWVKYTQALRPSNYGFSQYNLHLILRDFVGTVQFRNLKIEFGNKATDWTPAPEDVESDILEASKTATNYLNFSSSGLVIGDMTASTLGKNVLIDSDSVDIRNGTTTLASFGADYLYLAKNSRDAKIDLCNGLAEMYHTIDDAGYSIFNIDTTYGLSYIKMSAPMHDLLVLENTATTNSVIIKGMIHGTTVGGFGLVRDGYMVRYGSDADEDNPVEYRIHDEENFGKIDSNWEYGGVIGDGFSIYANDTQIQYRKIGKIVHIRGAVKPTTDIAGSTTSYTLFTLPEGYRPSVPVYARCQGSAANTWLLSITVAGAVRFSRYGYGTTYVTATAGTWLPFDVTFFID